MLCKRDNLDALILLMYLYSKPPIGHKYNLRISEEMKKGTEYVRAIVSK
jgi:hypothetical protein